MKKLLAAVSVLFLSLHTVFYAENKISIKAGGSAGVSNILLDEILYDKYGSDANISSLLKWQIYASPLISANTQVCFSDRFYICVDGKYSVPLSAGKMEDYDWLNRFSTGTGEQTHYSTHENNLNNYYSARFSLGAGGNLTNKIKLIQLFSIEYSNISLTAKNGYRQYAASIDEINGNKVYEEWSDTIQKKYLEGKIITYEVQEINFGLGLQLLFALNQNLNLLLSAQLLPSLTCQALDSHYKRNPPLYTLFKDISKLVFDSSFLIEYRLNTNNRLFASFGYRCSTSERIKLYQTDDKKSWEKVLNPGGIKQQDFTLSLGYTFYYEN